MSKKFAPKELPKDRTGGLLDWLDGTNVGLLALYGISAYFLVVLFFSIIEFICFYSGAPLVYEGNNPTGNFFNILYFNLITILTVGYGDFHPESIGKLFSVIEAFTGVGLFSVLVALITIKILLPPQNTIVFSKYAYYCTEPERFLIIFVNTTNTNLVNVEISSFFKLGLDWGVTPSVTSPFITTAVQTFYIDELYFQDIIPRLTDGDCLRVGMAGNLGFTRFSTSIQYSADEILVIPNRKELTDYDGFWKPDFNSPLFQQMFHYEPKGAITLKSHVENLRGKKNE